MIAILRLGERPERDHRINTHLALVARAFGAERLYMTFTDPSLLASVLGVNERFGGGFSVEILERNGWRRVVREWPGTIVHLTMYGIPLDTGLQRLRDGDAQVEKARIRDDVAGTNEVTGAGEARKTDEIAGPDRVPGTDTDLLVIVGGEKVPPEVYQLSHLNIAVGNQPHSEVAALAVFLDRYHEGRQLQREMPGWKQRIIPAERGKRSEVWDG